MNLKDRTVSVWERSETTFPHFQSVHHDMETEVCIIGGGITGVSIAYELAKRGHQVTLVEAFTLGSGQTGRTTAHLSCQLEEEFGQLLKYHDQMEVALFLESHKSAIDKIESIIQLEGIQCDFKRVNGYLFAGKNSDAEALKKEQKAAAKCGLKLEFIIQTPLLEKKIPSLKFKSQAQFHPLKYLHGMVKVLRDLGVKIFENTHIKEINTDDPRQSVIITEKDYEIYSKNLIVATNTPINNRFVIHTKQAPYRTYAMTFELAGEIDEECLLWDTEDPYHYIRFAGDTLIVGGEDHRTGMNPDHDPFNDLETWARQNFSFLGNAIHKWSGQIFEPTGQIGYIGRNPHDKNVYISTGESGIGMTSALIASSIIPDLIENKVNPWTKIFDPARRPTDDMSDFMRENIHGVINYKDWLTPSQVKNEKDIPIDSGSILRDGLTKNCVYHASEDEFETKCATCPHLGGIVHWNDIEKTWDCPVHGSRFNVHGKVIEGPAVTDLPEHS